MPLELAQRALALVEPLLASAQARVIVGIAGPPGAGKSTLAEQLVAEFGSGTPPAAVAVPMDGFHLAQAELVRLGLAHCKGAPRTFDERGYVHLLRRLRAGDELVYAPVYSRIVHESIGSAIAVHPETRLVVTEGNYLLLWPEVRPLLDLALYLDAPDEERVAGLLHRQLGFGLDEQAARDWVYRSDEANARLIETTRHRADAVLWRG